MTLMSIRESLTYADGAPRSFYRDLLLAKAFHDVEANERLEANEREMAVEYATRDRTTASPTKLNPDGSEPEIRMTRVDSNLGTGGEFTVPLWLVDLFASAGRAGRAFGDLLQPMLLPPGVSSVHTPRMTTGTTAGIAADSQPTPSQDFVTTDASSVVITIAGMSDISTQLFDQSPIGMDAAIFLDLNRAYNKALESQLLYGSPNGAGLQSTEQLLGVSYVTGISSVAGGSMNTVALLWPGIGQTAAAVGNTRLLPPTHMLMAPRRYYYIAFSVDSSLRPVGAPTGFPPKQASLIPDPAGGATPVDTFGGMPVYLDGAIPAGTNADDIFFLRPDDMFLWESNPRTIVAQNPLSGSLQLRLSLHRYVAFIPHRYPNGIGRLSALPQPSNY